MLPRSIITLLFLCWLSASLLAEPQLSVQLDRTAVYEGEAFHYQLVLSDTTPIDTNMTPDTSVWIDFDVQSLGKQTGQRGGRQSSFTMIINGKTVRDDKSSSPVTHLTQFSYALTPKRAGLLTIPLPRILVNGKVLSPQSFSVDEGERQIAADHSIAVRVWEPDDQDIVFMSIETNRNRLYPLQPLEVTLIVQIKGLPNRFAETNPLSLPQQPPQLQIPWAVDDLPRGLRPTEKLEDWLNNLLVRPQQRGLPPVPGFGINNYVSRLGTDNDLFLPFSFSTQRHPLQFSNMPKQVKRADAKGNETIYWEYRFSRTLIPQEFGNYFFGPVTLKGTLPVVDATKLNEVVGQKIYAVAKPVFVSVMDVPQENRPADYIGAFGSFRWEVNLAPQQARVGDPMTLTLRLAGQGSTVNVQPLDLSVNPDIAENFRVHMPPTEDINERSCSFTYTIRPQKPGTISFPPISVSVFDVNTEKFIALQSQPIPLDVIESETIQSATLFGNVAPVGDTQLVESGLFANKTTMVQILPPMTFVQWASAVSLFLAGYAVIALGVLLLRCQCASPRRLRHRGALNRAKSRLIAIASALSKMGAAGDDAGDTLNLVEISSDLQGVFFGYIADKTDGTEHGITTNEACQQLLENQVPGLLVDAIRMVLESLDAVKYGGMDIRSLDELTNTSGTLLQQLELHQLGRG